jgi:hypothetical protein
MLPPINMESSSDHCEEEETPMDNNIALDKTIRWTGIHGHLTSIMMDEPAMGFDDHEWRVFDIIIT